MIRLFIFALVGLLSTKVYTQCAPDVKALLDKVNNGIDMEKGYHIDFTIEMEYVGEPSNIQEGALWVKGRQFHLVMPQQDFISNGQDIWVHLKQDKEVQIMRLEDESEWTNLSPVALFQSYCSADYQSRSLGRALEDQMEVEQVEFSPKDKSEDLFKIRVNVSTDKYEVVKIRSFFKDGSRITLKADDYQTAIDKEDSFFVFDPASHPGIHIEDLR
jgi:outer membrane lipoprotein-sorting protein